MTNETEFGWRNGNRNRNPKRMGEGAEARGVVGREASVGVVEMRGAATLVGATTETVRVTSAVVAAGVLAGVRGMDVLEVIPPEPVAIVQVLHLDVESAGANRVISSLQTDVPVDIQVIACEVQDTFLTGGIVSPCALRACRARWRVSADDAGWSDPRSRHSRRLA